MILRGYRRAAAAMSVAVVAGVTAWNVAGQSAPATAEVAVAAPAASTASLRTLDQAPLVQVRRIREAHELSGTTDGCLTDANGRPIACALYAPGFNPRRTTDTPGPFGQAQFVVRDATWKWPQPGGLGSEITVTYSFSNLLNGGMKGISTADLQVAVREALSRWAAIAPLKFVQVADSGPTTINDVSYLPGTTPHLRFGHHTIDGVNGVLAHAFYPFDAVNDGLSGDLHFDTSETWSVLPALGKFDFLEVCVHEIGHSLGLDHQSPPPTAVMNPFYAGRLTGLGTSFLFTDDQDGIIAIYGEIPDEPEPPPPPTGEIKVVYNAGSRTLTLTGDQYINAVTISMRGRNLMLQAGNGTKLREETAKTTKASLTFANVGTTSKINIVGDLKAGADALSLVSLNVNNVDVNLGTGVDRATMYLSTITSLKLNGGSDTDTDTMVLTSSKVTTNTSTNFP